MALNSRHDENQQAKGIRAFVAVEVPEEIRSHIGDLQKKLGSRGFPVRWVRTEGIHVTLKFLGQLPAEKVDAAIEAVRQAVAGTRPFSLSVRGLGVFPGYSRPRVLWVGLAGEIEPLAALAGRIESAFEPLGFQRENRPFAPHITIGRVFDDADREAVQAMGKYLKDLKAGDFGEWTVSSVRLMRSQLQRGGAVYTPVAKFDLNQ